MESIKGKFSPAIYIKSTKELIIDPRAVHGRNIILCQSEEKIDRDSLIFLGKVLDHTPVVDFFGYNVWLDVSYPYVIMVPGRRGTGKSYTLGVIAEGLALTKHKSPVTTKSKSHCVVIIDTLGQFWQMKYKPTPNDEEGKRQLELLKSWDLEPTAIDNVQVFVPRGTKLMDSWKELSINFSEVEVSELAGLLDVDLYQDRMGQLLLHVYTKTKEEGYYSAIISEQTGEPIKKEFVPPKHNIDIDSLIKCIDSDYDVLSRSSGFEIQTRRALKSRLMAMRKWKVFAEKGTPISEICKEGMVSIINLEGVDEDLRNLIVAVLVRKIFQAREITRKMEKLSEAKGEQISRDANVRIPPVWLIIDEAHEYCPATGRTAAKEPLIRFAKEGRSLGLGLVMATQQPSALSPKISSQVEIIIGHALAFSRDIEAFEDRLVNIKVDEYQGKSRTLTFAEQIRLLPPGTAIVSAMNVSSTFLMTLRPRLTLHGGKAPKMVY
ncbi:MAG: ATP-binding protein [Candidatus Bathyarchaeia archaeon]